MRGRTVFAYAVGAVVYIGGLALGGWLLYSIGDALDRPNNPQWWAMLFKSALVFVFAAAAYFGIYLPLKWLERKWPEGKLKRLLFTDHILFSGRGTNGSDRAGP